MKVAVCVGCGCDDQHPCELGAFCDIPCRWLSVNRPKHLGVCSCCHGLQARNQSELKSDPEFSAQRFAELLETIYDREEGLRWYERNQPVLNGKTPRELVATGHIHRVRQAVNAIADGVLL